MMTSRLTPHHLSPVDVIGDRRLGRQRASLVDRRVDILPLPGNGSVDQRGHDGRVGEMAGRVPRIAAAGSNRRRIRHVCLVVAAGRHLAARSHVQQGRWTDNPARDRSGQTRRMNYYVENLADCVRSRQKIFDNERDARPVCDELRSLCPRNAEVINIEAEQDTPFSLSMRFARRYRRQELHFNFGQERARSRQASGLGFGS